MPLVTSTLFLCLAAEDVDRIWKNLCETLNSALHIYYANIDVNGNLVGYPLAE